MNMVFSQIIANLHYHADCIENYFEEFSPAWHDLALFPEEELMGTAGGSEKNASGSWMILFVVISGDH